MKRTGGKITTFDAGRGCPFQCSFCTIINVQGRKSRRRSADDIEQIIRSNLAQGINRFFITDDNFARNTDWENIFDRLIADARAGEAATSNSSFRWTPCATACRTSSRRRAGPAWRACSSDWRASIPTACWARARSRTRLPSIARCCWNGSTPASPCSRAISSASRRHAGIGLRDIEIIQRELPIDLLEFHCLTPLPGSEDHQTLVRAGAYLDPGSEQVRSGARHARHATMSQRRVGEALPRCVEDSSIRPSTWRP